MARGKFLRSTSTAIRLLLENRPNRYDEHHTENTIQSMKHLQASRRGITCWNLETPFVNCIPRHAELTTQHLMLTAAHAISAALALLSGINSS